MNDPLLKNIQASICCHSSLRLLILIAKSRISLVHLPWFVFQACLKQNIDSETEAKSKGRVTNDNYTLFSYKNILYRNIEAGICQKSKNILRIFETQIREDSPARTNQSLQRHWNEFKTFQFNLEVSSDFFNKSDSFIGFFLPFWTFVGPTQYAHFFVRMVKFFLGLNILNFFPKLSLIYSQNILSSELIFD